MLRQITGDLQELVATGEAEDIISLANVNDIIGTDDTFAVQPFLGTIPTTSEGLAALRQRALADPLYLKNLVSVDGRTAALYDADDLEAYVTPRFDHVRLAVRVQEDGTKAGARYVRDIERLIRELHRPDLRMRITGLAFKQVKTSEAVVHDQLLGLGEALVVIWLLTLVLLRSITLATFSIVPNMFPIILNFGIMGAAGIPVDTGTSIIAASAFGVIVDVTTRIFIAYRDLR